MAADGETQDEKNFKKIEERAQEYEFETALLLAKFCKLAYVGSDRIKQEVEQGGWTFEIFLDAADLKAVAAPKDQQLEDWQTSTQLFIARRDKTVALVFRGSEPKLDDWAVDLNAQTDDWAIEPGGPIDLGSGGQVHRGFRKALSYVWLRLLEKLDSLGNFENLWITGHSLGGALAAMTAARLEFGASLTDAERSAPGASAPGGGDPGEFAGRVRAACAKKLQVVYTFGQPRIGNWLFASNYEDRLGLRTYRFVNNTDIVPRVPPPQLDYSHAGRRLFFDQLGALGERDRAADVVGIRAKELYEQARGATPERVGAGVDGESSNPIADHSMLRYLEHLEQNERFKPEKLEAVTIRQVIWKEMKALGLRPPGQRPPGAAQSSSVAPPENPVPLGDENTAAPEGTAGQEDAVPERPIVALALSGGGIRSATFNLGLLQSLASSGLLSQFHYISTASGGGYIGAWLSAWLHRVANAKSKPAASVEPVTVVEQRLGGAGRQTGAPFNDAGEPREVTWLRRFSNYLTPRTGPFSADTLTAVATWLRNTLLNQLVLVSGLALSIVAAWLLASVTGSLALAGSSGAGAPPCSGWLLVPWVACLIGSLWMAWQESRDADSGSGGSAERSRRVAVILGVLWIMLPGVLLNCGAIQLHDGHAVLNFLVYGASAAALVAFALGAVLTALTHGWSTELGREWWARTNGALLKFALFWALAMTIVLYAPYVWMWSYDWLLGMGGIAWLATALGGAWSAFSGRSGKPGQTGPVEWMARVAPYIFIAGLLGAISTGVQQGLDGWAVRQGSVTAAPACEIPASTGWQPEYQVSTQPKGFEVASKLKQGNCHYPLYAERSLDAADQLWPWPLLAVVAVLGLVVVVLGCFVDINIFSLHFYYRNRLERCYLGASHSDRAPNVYTGLDRNDSPDLQDLGLIPDDTKDGDPLKRSVVDQRRSRPYLLINAALNLTHDPIEESTDRLGWQERKAASFLFSPLYCGYRLAFGERGIDAFQPTHRYGEGGGEPISLGMGITISGAAASPNSGYHTNPATAFLMTMFNARLGWWMRNPRKPRAWRGSGPWFSPKLLLMELLGWSSDRTDYIYLSDGGHFENLGIYELVRRRCTVIIASDAGLDENYSFEDLGNAIRKCRTDFGVEIDLDPRAIIPGADGLSQHHCAVGMIRYPETEELPASQGQLLYIKASLRGDESADLLQYKAQNPDFPNHTTADQWFSESRFESYRKLGQHIGDTALGEEYRQWPRRTDDDHDLVGFLDRLWRRWHRPSPHVEIVSSRHGRTVEKLFDDLRKTPELAALDAELSSDWQGVTQGLPAAPAAPAPTAAATRNILYFCAGLFRLMESVYVDLHLEDDHGHPDVKGWMNLFRQWGLSGNMATAWAIFGPNYGQSFRDFCEARLGFARSRIALGISQPDLSAQYLAPGAFGWLKGAGADWFVAQRDQYRNAYQDRNFDVQEFTLQIGNIRLPFGYAVVAKHRERSPVLVDFSIRLHLHGMGLGRRAAQLLAEKYPRLSHRRGIGGEAADELCDVLHAAFIHPASVTQ